MSVVNPLTVRKIKIGGPAFNALPKKIQIQLAVEADSLIVKPHINSKGTTNRYGQPVCETVLKIERNVVGQSAFTYDINKGTANLVNISVDAHSRKKGYGSLLWDKTIQECRGLGIKKLTFTAVPPGDSSSPKWNDDLKALVNWYKSKGAKVVKTEDKTPFMEYTIPYFGNSPKALKAHKVDRLVAPDRTKHIKDLKTLAAKHIKDLKTLAAKCFPKDILERIDVKDLDILQALSDTTPQKLRGVALVDVKAKRIELVCVYPENAAVRKEVIETAVEYIGGDFPTHNLEFDSNYQASLKVYSELGFTPLEIKMAKKQIKPESSPIKRSPKEWKIKTPKGILRIETACEETWPCQHSNSMDLDSTKIWALIKKQPSLRKSQPELWKHFSVYENAALPPGW
jgi:hypothetical protein